MIYFCGTWLYDFIFANEFINSRYRVYSQNRKLYIIENITFKNISNKSHDDGVLELISKKVDVCVGNDWQTTIEDLWITF